MKNRDKSKYANNSTGTTGVSKIKGQEKWRADISIGGTQKYLGTFGSLELAVQVREHALKKAIADDGFGKNHGK